MKHYRELTYRRILMIFGFYFLISAGLFIRLIIIQIANYQKYSELAAVQRQSTLANNPLRGYFFDRHGNIIRGMSEAWFLLVTKMNPLRFEQVAAILEPVLGNDLAPYYRKHRNDQYWIYPAALNSGQINQINRMRLPELEIVANLIRKDRVPGLAWHLLGFVDGAHGFSGLEYLYQQVLNKEQNYASIFALTDGRRNSLPGLGLRSQSKLNISGVILTLDIRIQEIADQIMDKQGLAGAIVVLDAKTGEILAMSSRPLVNLSDIGSLSSPDHPFVNRAVSAYHPGSIFKLVTLCAGLDSGRLNKEEFLYDSGFYQTGSTKWLCTTSNGGHGLISLPEALAYSCNPIFIQIAQRLQPQIILEYADRLGLGQPCNIGLRDESWGRLPSGIGLSDGDIANMALGQQDVYATPLQIASIVQTIANDGIRCVPRLVLGTVRPRGTAVGLLEKPPSVRVIKTGTAEMIKDMMTAVVAFGTGTAGQLGLGVAGKTGTAQEGDNREAPSHAWFVGFTPVNVPKYIAVVFCEKGISGAETAAPIFKELMEKVTINGD